MAKSREFLRCPCCGKLSRGPAFQVAATTGHALQVLTQWFVGGRGRAFKWTRAPASREHLVALVEVLRLVLARVQAQLAAASVLPAAVVPSLRTAARVPTVIAPVRTIARVHVRPNISWKESP